MGLLRSRDCPLDTFPSGESLLVVGKLPVNNNFLKRKTQNKKSFFFLSLLSLIQISTSDGLSIHKHTNIYDFTCVFNRCT